jgi:hypothetical protein
MENWIGKLTLKEEDQLEEFENGILMVTPSGPND